MYRFYINNIKNEYHYSELARVFMPNSRFEIIPVNFNDVSSGERIAWREYSYFVDVPDNDEGRMDALKRKLYELLVTITDFIPEWGTLTGVHPLKLAYEARRSSCGAITDYEKIEAALEDRYLLNHKKSHLLTDIMKYRDQNLDEHNNAHEKISVYIGIPFCPSICEYCSFASEIPLSRDDVDLYFEKLCEEITFSGEMSRQAGYNVESLYVGGGTPTILDGGQIEELIGLTCESYGINPRETEITIEAGRPDTISRVKLEAMKRAYVCRISINPQSLNDNTLKRIGRNHSSNDIFKSFELAGEVGFDVVNSDIIAGLQGESVEDFARTLSGVIGLNANNITVHTLSVKRGSRLKNECPEYFRRSDTSVRRMLDYAYEKLTEHEYFPYYIYKQKKQIGGYENVGWCRNEKHNIYNIRILDEDQTIVGLGAGAIGKRYYPEGNSEGKRIVRIPNFSDYETYINRFDEVLERKKKYFD